MLFIGPILACALLPRDGAAQSGLGPLVSIISKDSLSPTWPTVHLIEALPQLRPFSLGDSRFVKLTMKS